MSDQRVARRTTQLAALIILLIFACSDDPSVPTEDPPGIVSDAELTVGTVRSAGRVDVTGLPAPTSTKKTSAVIEVGDITAVLAAEGANDIRTPLEHDAGGWYFIAPLHPVDPLNGGAFQVYLTDGKDKSKTQSLTVEPLPAAPGAFAAAVAKTREYLELLAVSGGTTIEDLKAANPETLNPVLLPLKLSQSYLDDDSDPNDMMDLAANTSGFLSAEQVDLLDRLFGEFELERLLQLQIDGARVAAARFPDRGATPGKSTSRVQRANGAACIQARLAIDNAADLSWRMTNSAVYAFGADPESEAGEILVTGTNILAAVGFVWEDASVPIAVAGTLIATVQAAVGFVAGIMPSKFTGIDYDVSRTEFDEDTATPGVYSHVEVVAESDGWVADQSITATAAAMLGPYMSNAARERFIDSNVFGEASSLGIGTAATAIFGETSIIEFCPEVWVVDITPAPYTTAAVQVGKFAVDTDAHTYTPLEQGSDILRVAANVGYFGGRTIAADVGLFIREIVVTVEPTDIVVDEPGQTVGFYGDIQYAEVRKLAWAAEHGDWVDGLPDTTDGEAARLLKTPPAVDAYPFAVTVTSASRQGPRASGTPARMATANVRLAAQAPLIIEPAFACLKNQGTQQFRATRDGVVQTEITWELASGTGNLDANGFYTAPATGTTDAAIYVYLTEDEGYNATGIVNVESCDCWFNVTVTGDDTWSYQGTQIGYFTPPQPAGYYQFNYRFDPVGTRSVGTNIWDVIGPTPAIGETGLFNAGVSYASGDLAWTPGIGTFEVLISKHEASYMEGRFGGEAYRYNQQNEIISTVYIQIDFKALRYPYLGSIPCP